jgi:hypothetical protein
MKLPSAQDLMERRKYVLIQWPESQLLMDYEWFNTECYLANNERTLEDIGSSAYFVPEDRIEELTMQIDRWNFEIGPVETRKLEKWKKKQMKKDPFMPTAGERWTFMITPTGIGTVVKVKDETTGDIIDLTDWDNW